MSGNTLGTLFTVTFGIVVLAIVVLALRWAIATQSRTAAGSYRAAIPLSEPEQTLYWRLREAMPECVVLCQVSFSRFLEPHGAPPAARQALFNRIAQKSADFLVCLPDFTVVAAVELDDGTHRRMKDARRDSILQSAGLPVVRMHVRDIPSVERLRAMFTNEPTRGGRKEEVVATDRANDR